MQRSKNEKKILNDDSIVVASKNQVSCEMGEEVVLLDLESGLYFGLENVGSCIWKLIQRPTAIAEILETVNQKFDTSDRDVRDEIIGFLEELSSQGLLQCTPAGKAHAGDREHHSPD